MYRAMYLTSMDDISTLKSVRARVEELGAKEDDPRDLLAVYVLAYDEADSACGCGRMYIDSDSRFRIDQLGVLASHRRRYIGDLLARMLLARAQSLNAGSVYARCPRSCAGFFARYGFIATPGSNEGGEFVDMYVPGDAIRLEGKCGRARPDGCAGQCDACELNPNPELPDIN